MQKLDLINQNKRHYFNQQSSIINLVLVHYHHYFKTMTPQELENQGINVQELIILENINAILIDTLEANTRNVSECLSRGGLQNQEIKQISNKLTKLHQKLTSQVDKKMESDVVLQGLFGDISDFVYQSIMLLVHIQDEEKQLKAISSLKLLQ